MRISKVLAIILAALTLALVFVSCGNTTENMTENTVKVDNSVPYHNAKLVGTWISENEEIGLGASKSKDVITFFENGWVEVGEYNTNSNRYFSSGAYDDYVADANSLYLFKTSKHTIHPLTISLTGDTLTIDGETFKKSETPYYLLGKTGSGDTDNDDEKPVEAETGAVSGDDPTTSEF